MALCVVGELLVNLRSDSFTFPDAVIRVWQYRERVEWEAADVFSRLARSIGFLRGEDDTVSKLAKIAASDELRHASLCRAILQEGGMPIEVSPRHFEASLGPRHLNESDRLLYGCVALGCVTESLSTALLIEMRRKAGPKIIQETIHEILEDEILHSRIGWAELARAAEERDVSWLSEYIPGMIVDAIATDVAPNLSSEDGGTDMSAWGILHAREATRIMRETFEGVIMPGLDRFGVKVIGQIPTVAVMPPSSVMMDPFM